MASRFTAMSLDVRKVYDLPVALPKFMGLRPVNWGAAPKPKADFGRWGIAATAHQAAEPRPPALTLTDVMRSAHV